MGNINITEKYFNLFEHNPNFQKEYLSPKRRRLYQEIVSMIKELRIGSVIDIGCAYGLLVELANSEGINAYGLDLPINNLKIFHDNLPLSKGNFIYGSIEDKRIIRQITEKKIQGIILLDTLRYIEKINEISLCDADFIIIKEISNNFYIRRDRRRKKQFDIKLFSPHDFLEMFPKYQVFKIYATKLLFHIKNPSSFVLKALNLLPTYTIVLKRREQQ